MKRPILRIFLYVGLIFYSSQVLAQVGIGTTTPSPHAVLELKAPGNNQGFLVPRLTTMQRTAAAFTSALSSVEKGLLVFDTDTNKFYYWSGSAWIIIEDSVGTDSQTLSFNPSTGLLSITGGNNITISGTLPGGGAGGDLTGTYPNPTVTNNAITSAKILDATIATADLADGSVTTAKITDGTLTNADVSTSAAIAVSKVAAGTNGQVLLTTAGVPTWSAMPAASGTAGGDLTGTYPNPTVANGTITSAKITDATIVTADLADGSVTTAKVVDGTLATADLADGSVTTAKILDATVATADLADASVTTAKVADGTLTNADVSTSAAIAVSKVAAGTNGQVLLTTAGVPTWSAMPAASGTAGGDLTGAYPNPTVTNDAITTAKILDGAITNADINASAAIAVSKVAAGTNGQVLLTAAGVPTWSAMPGATGTAGGDLTGSYPNPTVANSTITSAKITDATIATADLADGSVTTAKILDATIATADLADASVTSAKVVDATLTNADVSATAAVAVSKLAAGTNTNVLTTVAGVPTWQPPVDNSASNEIQTLSVSGTTLTISSGNSVTLPSSGGVSGSGTSGQVAFWSGSSSISGNSNLLWDEKDNRLGIGLTPLTNLHVGGSHAVTFTVTSTSDYDVDVKDYVIFVPSATNNLWLPDAAAIPGRVLIIRSADQDKGVTIRAKNGKDLIDGVAAMQLFDRAGEAYTVTLISNGNNWFSISKSHK